MPTQRSAYPSGTTAEPRIALDQRGGDVWAWERRLTGTFHGVPGDATISLFVDGEAVPVLRYGDAFAATLRLAPGPNAVRAVATLPDGKRAESEPITHTVRLSPRPVARVAVRVQGDTVVVDGSPSEPSLYDAAPITAWAWSAHADNAEPLLSRPDVRTGKRLTLPAPTVDGQYIVSLEVTDAVGRTDTGEACLVMEGGAARAFSPATDLAAWIDRAVVYGVDVRAFSADGIPGITARIDDLADLGVTALWLTPITGALPDDFGYGVTDYFAVREAFGAIDDLRAVVDSAHARGVRVLLDLVPNHTSAHHPYALDAAEHGAASPYIDFHDRDANQNPTHYFNWTHLPNVNMDNHEVRRFLTETFTFWLRECGVDGFRVDAAWGIRQRRPEFWPELTVELRRIRPDCMLIAEASARDPFYATNGFDAAYDWTDELGVWAWTAIFGGDRPVGEALREAIIASGQTPDARARVLRFLNNNDTGARFVTTHGVDAYRAALTMLLTLPGIPCLYTGDDVGAEFHPYDGEGSIDWTDRQGLRALVRRLIALRRDHAALHGRGWQPLDTVEGNVFAYLRWVDGAARCVGTDPMSIPGNGNTDLRHPSTRGGHGVRPFKPILVVLNLSPSDTTTTVTLPARVGRNLIDLWSGEPMLAPGDGTLTFSMPGWSFRILEAHPAEEVGP